MGIGLAERKFPLKARCVRIYIYICMCMCVMCVCVLCVYAWYLCVCVCVYTCVFVYGCWYHVYVVVYAGTLCDSVSASLGVQRGF